MTQFQRSIALSVAVAVAAWILFNLPKFIGDACVLIQGRW